MFKRVLSLGAAVLMTAALASGCSEKPDASPEQRRKYFIGRYHQPEGNQF